MHLATEGGNEATANGKAEAETFLEVVDLGEGFEDAFAVFLFDADTSVGNVKEDTVDLLCNLQFHIACICELCGVI